MQNDTFRYVGILASFTAWLAIAVVLYKWPVVKSKSISKHVSAYKQAWLLFAPIETIALILLYVFMMKWFIPVLALSGIYKLLVTMALILELVTTWVPDTTGLKQRVHHYTAYSAVLLLPILNILIANSPVVSFAGKVTAYVSLIVMVGIITMYVTTKNTREKHLIYQSIYFACFHIPMLVIIFTTV